MNDEKRLLLTNNLEVAKMMLDEIVKDGETESRIDEANDLLELISKVTKLLENL